MAFNISGLAGRILRQLDDPDLAFGPGMLLQPRRPGSAPGPSSAPGHTQPEAAPEPSSSAPAAQPLAPPAPPPMPWTPGERLHGFDAEHQPEPWAPAKPWAGLAPAAPAVDAPAPAEPAPAPAPAPASASASASATAAAPSVTPSASAFEIASLELTLADPAVREMDAAFGGAAVAPGGSASAEALVARYGAGLAARLDRHHRAILTVRVSFAHALFAAASSPPGPGWFSTIDTQSTQDDGNNLVWRFDPAAFTAHWSQDNGFPQRAFVAVGLDRQTWQAHRPGGAVAREQALMQWTSSAGLSYQTASGTLAGGSDSRAAAGVQGLRLDALPELHDSALVWFDPQLGWVTAAENVVQRQSTLEKTDR